MTDEPQKRLTADEIVELSKRYTLFDWAAQSKLSPIPVARAEGVYFYDPDGKRYLDFNSQLMSVNIGHGDRRVADAVARQVAELAYVNSAAMTTEVRALLGQKLAKIFPGDIEKFFFTLGGAEANENAIRIARAVTGRHKILARYRSYHGATSGSITLTASPGSCTCSTSTTARRGRWTRPRSPSPSSRRLSSSKARRRSRRSSSSR
jgi:taurine--2-oxoglutarate transaminase